MSFSEAIVVRLGLDKASFDNNLKGAQHLVEKFKRGLEFVGLGFGAHWAKEFVMGIAEMAAEIKATSEALNVGTDFLQGWRHGAELVQVTADTATRGLEKFAEHIGEASKGGKAGAEMAKVFQHLGISLRDSNGVTKDTEELLGEVADRFKGMEDPAERARIAVELFGKTGVRLIPILKDGAAGIAKLKEETLKLTEAELENLEAFDRSAKTFALKSKVIGGELVSSVTGTVKQLGAAWKDHKIFSWPGKLLDDAMFRSARAEVAVLQAKQEQKALEKTAAIRGAGVRQQEEINAVMEDAGKEHAKTTFELMSAEEKLNVLLAFRKSLMDELKQNPKASVENAKRIIAVEKASLDIGKEQKALDREKLETLEKQARFIERQTDATKRLAQAWQAEGEARHDRSASSLQELAERTPWTLAGFMNRRRANEILGAEARARVARAEGRGDIADSLTDYATKLRQGFDALSKSEQEPLESVAQNTRDAADTLAKIQKDGIAVSNGQ